MMSLAFSPDGKHLAVAVGDEVIRLWDCVQGKLLRGFVGHQGPVQAVAFAPRGDVLASGGADSTIRLWKIHDGQEVRCFEGHQGAVTRLAFADDGRTLISTGPDNCILVWDAASRALVPRGDLKGKKLDPLWADLASDDAMVAFKAMGELILAPKEAVAFLSDKLEPVPATDPAVIEKLIGELDSKNFQAREKATKELQKLETVGQIVFRFDQARGGRRDDAPRRVVRTFCDDVQHGQLELRVLNVAAL